MHWEVVSVILSLFALVVSVKAWQKSRSIYALETTTLRQVRGRSDDIVIEEKLKEINKKLTSGRFTILHITERQADGDFQIFLGKIKK